MSCHDTGRLATDRRSFIKVLGAGTVAAAIGAPHLRAAGAPSPHVYRVHHIPVPSYTYGNRHPGVESLLFLLAVDGVRFYKSTKNHPLARPDGLIGANDVVLIKVNAQWKYRGCTNSDVVRGVVQRILDHPDGFTGEVVIVENGQGRGSLNCDTQAGCDGGTTEVHANAENESHSFVYLVNQVFQDPRVGQRLLDGIRTTFIGASDHVTEGYRTVGHVTYPCFFTPRGTRVEFREGIWTGSGYDSSRLKWINIPVMKDHKDLNVTGSLKNTYGLLSTYNEMLQHHDPTQGGQEMGEFMSLTRAPALNIVDHIWVPFASLCGYPASTTTRRDMLTAGFDPCALDAWAARHILYPISGDPAHDPDVPGYFRTYLTNARDTINANGGLYGHDVTFDEALTTASHQDQREIVVGIERAGTDMRFHWAGGAPPYRIEKSLDRQFTTPIPVAQGLFTGDFTEPGGGLGSQNWYYRVVGS